MSLLVRRIVQMAAMIAVGVVAGWMVWWLSAPASVAVWWQAGAPLLGGAAAGFWHSGLSGAVYAPVMWTAILAARRALYRRVPLVGIATGALHVLGVSATGAVAFVALLSLDQALCTALGLACGPQPAGAILGVAFVLMGVITTALYLADFARRARHAEQAAVAAEQAAVAAELRALRAQINPHFLFNALNSVAALARSRPAEAERVTGQLADLFRYTLRASKHPTVSLADEIEATRLYAGIEKVRYGDRLQIVFEVPDALLGVAVPSLTLQPLVENAVKHGVGQTEDACAVLVRAEAVGIDGGPGVSLSVRDTGPGFDTTGPEVFTRGTGLGNVRDRVRLLYGAETTFDVLPDGVRLSFPRRDLAEKQKTRTPTLSA